MIGCLRTCVRKQPIIALYFKSVHESSWEVLPAEVVFCFLPESNIPEGPEYEEKLSNKSG